MSKHPEDDYTPPTMADFGPELSKQEKARRTQEILRALQEYKRHIAESWKCHKHNRSYGLLDNGECPDCLSEKVEAARRGGLPNESKSMLSAMVDGSFWEPHGQPAPPDINTLRGSILSEAKGLTEGDRNKAYGPPEPEYRRLAAMISAYLGDKLSAPLSSVDAVQIMVLMKMNRSKQGGRRDTFVDQAAYSAIAGECALGECDETA